MGQAATGRVRSVLEHVSNPRSNDDIVHCANTTKREGADKRWWDYRALFNSRASRYRLATNVVFSIFAQWAGTCMKDIPKTMSETMS